MIVVRRLLALGIVVGAVAVGSVSAAPTLVSPAPGSSITSSRPTFTWTLPAGEAGESISVARSSKINPKTNDFVLANLQDSDILELGSSSWKPDRAMPAGKYYWHVASHSADQTHMFSPIDSFVIKPAITKVGVAVKSYKGQRTFLITTSWFANERTVTVTEKLFAGSKLLGSHTLKTDNFIIDAQKLDLTTWILPATVKKGASLRFVVTLKSKGGAKASLTKTLRAP